MSDSYHSLLVVFREDIGEAHMKSLQQLLTLLDGVIAVRPNVSGSDAIMAEERAKRDLGEKLWRVLYPKEKA